MRRKPLKRESGRYKPYLNKLELIAKRHCRKRM